jgi:hypothetical protein
MPSRSPSDSTIQHDSRQTSDLWAAAAGLTADVNAQDSAIDDYLLSADPQAVSRFEAAIVDETTVTAQMRAEMVDLPGLDRAVTALESFTAMWRSSYARPVIAAVKAGGGPTLAPFAQRASEYDDPIHQRTLQGKSLPRSRLRLPARTAVTARQTTR